METLKKAFEKDRLAKSFGMEIVELRPGYARVSMPTTKEQANIFGLVHGGAVFSVLDTAFQLACNSHGKMAVALNLSITYTAATEPGEELTATVEEVSRTPRTGTYLARVTAGEDKTVAVAQALAYRKKTPLEEATASD